MKTILRILSLSLLLSPLKSFGGAFNPPDCGGAIIQTPLPVARLSTADVVPAQVEAGIYSQRCHRHNRPLTGLRINIVGPKAVALGDVIVSVSTILNGKVETDFVQPQTLPGSQDKGVFLFLSEQTAFYTALKNGSPVVVNIKSRSPWQMSGKFTVQ